MEAETATPNGTINKDLETLLTLFAPQELLTFYQEHSKQMLLTTSAQIERHQALQELLTILAKHQMQ